MAHGDLAIKACGISKTYAMWSSPSARLSVPIARKLAPSMPGILRNILMRYIDSVYSTKDALADISFEIRKGESVGIVGRNGSGKSTLLQIIAGILQQSGGTAQVNGRISALIELGSGFSPDYTGRENVYLSAAIIGMSASDIEQRIDFIMKFADIGAFFDRPVRTYSTGMYLRLAFAVAISVDPEILIVDEALAVGDVFFQQKCFRHMREELQHRTRILVTHSMQAVTSLCERVLILDNGRLVFDGDPWEGIAIYTREMHNAQKGTGNTKPATVKETGCEAGPSRAIPWKHVDPADTGGIGDVRITAVSILINGVYGECVVKHGDTIQACLKLDSASQMFNIIIGYLVRDKTGLAVFAENTMSFLDAPLSIDPGVSVFRLAFKWPHISPGPYFLTLGVGQGQDALQHDVQCWAHNVAGFESLLTDVPVHAVFNNPIRAFERLP